MLFRRRRSSPEPAPRNRDEARANWLELVIEWFGQAPSPDTGYLTPHWVFQRKVLGRDRKLAMADAMRFAHAPLDREACQRIAAEWWQCSSCGGPLTHSEQDLCPQCAQEAS